MEPSAPQSNTKAHRWQTATRHAHVVRESGARSHTVHLGSVLRTTMLSTQPRMQTEKGMPNGPHRNTRRVGRDQMVPRRRHQRMLRLRMLMPPSRTRAARQVMARARNGLYAGWHRPIVYGYNLHVSCIITIY